MQHQYSHETMNIADHLWSDSQHFEGGRNVEVPRDADIAEVSGEGLAPHAEVVDVKHRQRAGQRDYQRFACVLNTVRDSVITSVLPEAFFYFFDRYQKNR